MNDPAGSRIDKRTDLDWGALAWGAAILTVYLLATIAVALHGRQYVDRTMTIALDIAHGHLDIGNHPSWADTVTVGQRTYHVVGLLPIAPYLLFVPFPPLWMASRLIISTGLAIVAAWMCLPLARRYGPSGPTAYWLATFGALGTLLFTLGIQGNFYYLAHVEAMLFTLAALLEWRGRRRAWVIGLTLGVAALARPTLLLAALPFGVAVVIGAERGRIRALVAYLVPLGFTVAIAGLYNAVRFGSPLETGYGISVLRNAALAHRRAIGLFSIRHVPDNLALLVGQGFDVRARFPYLVPNLNGHSIFLTSPALLAAIGAGLRDRTAQVLWAATFLVMIPLLLYYGGGGFATYGYRYFLDVVPFLLALVAMAARVRFGALEKLLVASSIAFVAYGLVWIVWG